MAVMGLAIMLLDLVGCQKSGDLIAPPILFQTTPKEPAKLAFFLPVVNNPRVPSIVLTKPEDLKIRALLSGVRYDVSDPGESVPSSEIWYFLELSDDTGQPKLFWFLKDGTIIHVTDLSREKQGELQSLVAGIATRLVR